MVIETYFSDIRSKLLSLLPTATKSIQLAVAWFTDQKLFDALIERLEAGVSVEILIRDDYVNNHPDALDWQQFIDKEGSLYFASFAPLHHKFCVIDNEIVVHGSYNWTYSAAFHNLESCVIISSQDVAQSFVEEMIKLTSYLMSERVIARRVIDHSISQYQIDIVRQERKLLEEKEVQINDNVPRSLLEAILLYQNKQYDESIQCVKNIIKVKPNSKKALFCLAENYYRVKQYEKATLVIRDIIEMSEKQAHVWNLLGLIHAENRNYMQSIECYNKAILLKPMITTWYCNKFWAVQDAKMSSHIIEKARLKVLEISRKEILKSKDNPRRIYFLMKCYIERAGLRNDIPEARKDINKAAHLYNILDYDEQDLHDLDIINTVLDSLK